MPICGLCDKEKTLIESHLIPESFMNNLYDEKGRTIYASHSRKVRKVLQKGLTEKILCSHCDGSIIGILDKYAVEVIRDKKHVTYIQRGGESELNGINYTAMKLFHMSILLRAHLFKKYSKCVCLPDNIVKKIKDCILTNNAPDPYEFAVYGFNLINLEERKLFYDGIITMGQLFLRSNDASDKVYVFIFGGVAWNYIVPRAGKEDVFEKYFLKEQRLILLHQDVMNFGPIRRCQKSINMVDYSKLK